MESTQNIADQGQHYAQQGIDQLKSGAAHLKETAYDTAAQLKSSGSEVYESLRGQSSDQLNRLKELTQREPLKVVLASAGIGFALGMLLRK